MKKLLLGILLFGLNESVFAQENDSTIVFSEAVALAQEVLDSLGIEAVMLGGETYYDSFMDDSEYAEGEEFGFEDRSMGLRATGSAASVFGRPLAMSEHEGDSVHPGPGPGMAMMPNGYSDWWSVYAYYTELDSVIAFEVGVEGVWDAYLFGEDEMEEEGIDVSLVKPLPQAYIDSRGVWRRAVSSRVWDDGRGRLCRLGGRLGGHSRLLVVPRGRSFGGASDVGGTLLWSEVGYVWSRDAGRVFGVYGYSHRRYLVYRAIWGGV